MFFYVRVFPEAQICAFVAFFEEVTHKITKEIYLCKLIKQLPTVFAVTVCFCLVSVAIVVGLPVSFLTSRYLHYALR